MYVANYYHPALNSPSRSYTMRPSKKKKMFSLFLEFVGFFFCYCLRFSNVVLTWEPTQHVWNFRFPVIIKKFHNAAMNFRQNENTPTGGVLLSHRMMYEFEVPTVANRCLQFAFKYLLFKEPKLILRFEAAFWVALSHLHKAGKKRFDLALAGEWTLVSTSQIFEYSTHFRSAFGLYSRIAGPPHSVAHFQLLNMLLYIYYL